MALAYPQSEGPLSVLLGCSLTMRRADAASAVNDLLDRPGKPLSSLLVGGRHYPKRVILNSFVVISSQSPKKILWNCLVEVIKTTNKQTILTTGATGNIG
jgi:hypothetical protein